MLYIFDADGTLREDCGGRPPFTHEEQVIRPRVRERIKSTDWGIHQFAIVSNQASVGRGLVTEEMATTLLRNLAFELIGANEAQIRICPHLPGDNCYCRKPSPMMLLNVKNYYKASQVLFIGNAESDRQAALAAGVYFAWESEFFTENY